MVISELSSVILNFLRGRRVERRGKEGGVDGDSGKKREGCDLVPV